jgi:hypothetical protein
VVFVPSRYGGVEVFVPSRYGGVEVFVAWMEANGRNPGTAYGRDSSPSSNSRR